MVKFWCKTCSVFVEDSRIERLKHESSSRHQSAVRKQIQNLHGKNKTIAASSKAAQLEIARINGQISGTINDKGKSKDTSTFKISKPAVSTAKKTKRDSELLVKKIGQWETVAGKEPVETKMYTPGSKKVESKVEKELKSWDFTELKQIDDDEEEEEPMKISFKKRTAR